MTQNEKLKILWIDDAFAYDLHAMMAYVDELRGSKGGFDVKEIARSDEALEILESGTDEFVCIILDIMNFENFIFFTVVFGNFPDINGTGVRMHNLSGFIQNPFQ